MESLNASALPAGTRLLLDSAPVIYVLEGHRVHCARYLPLFERFEAGEIHLVVTPITIAEVLSGPLKSGAEALARRYRAALGSIAVVDIGADIAEDAARLRVRYGLKLPDALQLACALAIGADGVVTHDRDFGSVAGIRIFV